MLMWLGVPRLLEQPGFFCVSTLGFCSSQVSGKREEWLMIVAEILVMMLIRGTCVRIFSFFTRLVRRN